MQKETWKDMREEVTTWCTHALSLVERLHRLLAQRNEDPKVTLSGPCRALGATVVAPHRFISFITATNS